MIISDKEIFTVPSIKRQSKLENKQLRTMRLLCVGMVGVTIISLSAMVFAFTRTSDAAQTPGTALPISKGGTDATTASEALTNLGGLGDASSDGTAYARKDGAWVAAAEPEVISSTETLTGETWGGQPVYSRSFSGNIGVGSYVNGAATLVSGFSSSYHLHSQGGYVYGATGPGYTEMFPVGGTYLNPTIDASSFAYIQEYRGNLILYTRIVTDRTVNGRYRVWIKYTKAMPQ